MSHKPDVLDPKEPLEPDYDDPERIMPDPDGDDDDDVVRDDPEIPHDPLRK